MIMTMYKNRDRCTGSEGNFFFLGGQKKLRVGPYFDRSVRKPESHFLGLIYSYEYHLTFFITINYSQQLFYLPC